MKTFYTILTHCTSKSFSTKDKYQTFDVTEEYAETKEEIKRILKDRYGNCKRQPMYIDNKDGSQVKIGYVYGFRNKDYSHNSKSWLQADWVEIFESTNTRLLL